MADVSAMLSCGFDGAALVLTVALLWPVDFAQSCFAPDRRRAVSVLQNIALDHSRIGLETLYFTSGNHRKLLRCSQLVTRQAKRSIIAGTNSGACAALNK